MSLFNDLDIAIIIPCYNEQVAIATVVNAFTDSVPSARIYVYDNNSTDDTVVAARQAGATVRTEALQGKGHVVRRMFADIEADFYVLVDGDATYEAAAAARMVAYASENGLDMVNGVRVSHETAAYRNGHRVGNFILTSLVSQVFGHRISDMLSGYRVFSRRFVKSFPASSGGFEIETELTVHALELSMPIGEIETTYISRPEGSKSKLSTYKDGARILFMIVELVKQERPLTFFMSISAGLMLLGLGTGIPVISDYLKTGLVPRMPSALLATGFIVLAALAAMCGLILDSVALGRRELKRLFYLRYSAPPRLLENATPHGPRAALNKRQNRLDTQVH